LAVDAVVLRRENEPELGAAGAAGLGLRVWYAPSVPLRPSMDFRAPPSGASRAWLRVRKGLGSVFGIERVVDRIELLRPWMVAAASDRHFAGRAT
jgi:hypothetical protein